MQLELVSIPTDTQPLDGVWCEPRQAHNAALIMHGNQGNFYVGPPRFLPPALAEIGIASLAFNRRGHDILATYRGREPVGGATQLTDEAIADNRHADSFVRDRGFDAPVIVGHSHGGLLAARHAADHPQTPALILLSPARGGVEATRIDSRRGLLLGASYDELCEQAKRLVAQGRGNEFLQLPGWWWVISANSLVDRLSNLPDLVSLAPEIGCPTLCLKSTTEPEEAYPVQAFASSCAGTCDIVELDCDHWYNGKDDQVARAVSTWLERVAQGTAA